jgi:hypothetical protein
MKTRSVFLLTMAFLLCVAVSSAGSPQARGGQAHAAPPARAPQATRPRANQGHVPSAPPARSDKSAPREPEHFSTGHINDTPHVNHNTWYGHEPANDARFHLDKPFEHGHFAHVGANYRYRVSRFDAGNREFWLPGGFFFQIADFDWALASDWCWDCGDDFTVYEDPDHPGWYLVYNVQTGAYVHAQYMGG